MTPTSEQIRRRNIEENYYLCKLVIITSRLNFNLETLQQWLSIFEMAQCIYIVSCKWIFCRCNTWVCTYPRIFCLWKPSQSSSRGVPAPCSLYTWTQLASFHLKQTHMLEIEIIEKWILWLLSWAYLEGVSRVSVHPLKYIFKRATPFFQIMLTP